MHKRAKVKYTPLTGLLALLLGSTRIAAWVERRGQVVARARYCLVS